MFLETAEKLNTINKTVAESFGSSSTTVFLGLGFCLLLFIFLVYKVKVGSTLKRGDPRIILVVLIIVCWWPMFTEKILVAWRQIFIEAKNINASAEVKLETRLCDIDKNQEYKGSVCLLEPFVREIKSLVPAQAKLSIVSDGFYSLFLKYYLMATYQITARETADYWIIYLPETGYQFNSDNELFEIKGQDRKNLGHWQVIKIFNQGMVILKKQ